MINRGAINIMFVLAIFFGVGTVVFGVLAIVAFSQSSHAQAVLATQKDQAASAARADQKSKDAKAALAATESPYQSFVAPDLYGGFTIKFPKGWSAYVQENDSSQLQLNLLLQPNIVTSLTNGDNAYAAHIQLVAESMPSYMQSEQGLISGGVVKENDQTVSNIQGIELTGKVDGKHNGITVVVPVRDKVLLIGTENLAYSTEFGQILSQAIILP